MSDNKKQLRLSLSSYSNRVETERKLGEIRQLRRRIRKRVKELEAKELAQLAAKVEVCKRDAARMHQAARSLCDGRGSSKTVVVHDVNGNAIDDKQERINTVRAYFESQFNGSEPLQSKNHENAPNGGTKCSADIHAGSDNNVKKAPGL